MGTAGETGLGLECLGNHVGGLCHRMDYDTDGKMIIHQDLTGFNRLLQWKQLFCKPLTVENKADNEISICHHNTFIVEAFMADSASAYLP